MILVSILCFFRDAELNAKVIRMIYFFSCNLDKTDRFFAKMSNNACLIQTIMLIILQ